MNDNHQEKQVIAAFDFDGTLTRHDTLLPFLLFVAGPWKFIYKNLLLVPVYAAYALRLMRNDRAKIRVLHRFLHGMLMTELQNRADSFASTRIPGMQRENAMHRLAWHKQQGHRCIVVSASLELYLKPWAIQAGFSDVLGSQLDILENGTTSGMLQGENCFGVEKLHRLESLLGPLSNYTVYAYGDSRGDRELLEAATYPYYRKFED